MEIINPQTQLNGAGPYNTQAYTFTGNMLLDLWGNAASDTVGIIRLLQTSGTSPTTNNQMCCVTAGTDPVPIATKPLKRCNDGVAYDAALNASVNSLTIPAGTYLFRFSGAGFTAKTTRMTAENTERKACDCDCLPITAAALPAATKAIAPCSATFPKLWDYDQTVYNTLPAFVAAYKAAMLPVVVTFDGACTFSAPNGTAMLPAALSAAPVPAPIYCPSQPLLDGGFGYHIADPKDPAATVEIAPCAGDTSTDSIWVYPAAAPGRTAKITDCDGVTIGYGANQSNCAVTCPCPDMTVTVNNAAPVNNVSVAAPSVSVAAPTVNVAPAVNNFTPTTNVAAPSVTNNFTPTTNVAAPTVVMPPAPVTGVTIGQNGAVTVTSTNAAGQQTTVVSNDLPSC